jgi:hypothetical protein
MLMEEIMRQLGVSDATYYKWQKGMADSGLISQSG